jgi:O-antigen ligase
VGVLLAATLVLLIVTDGNLAAVLAPAALVALVALALRLPMRALSMTLVFLAVATESQGDSGDHWHSPLYTLGLLLHHNLNLVLPIQALRFTGIDLLIAGLFALTVFRRARRDPLEAGPRVSSPAALRGGAVLTLGTLALLIAMGKATGGDLNQVYWQTHQFALVPVVFLLLEASLRGAADLRAVGRTYVAAALLKAFVAIYVSLAVRTPNGTPLPCMTSHGDSVLFAGACAIMIASFIERPVRSQLVRVAVFLPPILLAMVVNNRRLVWVEMAGLLLCFYLLSPVTRLKQKLTRGAVWSLPALALYLAAGWNSGSSAFKPVQTIKSLVVSKTDRSTEERDVENFNLLYTMRQHPIFGTGYGHEYIEVVKGDDISDIFPQYRYIPHNSLLGVWAFAGTLGFTGLWMIVGLAVFFAARAYRASTAPTLRAAALAAIGVVFVYMIQCYGDMGFVSWTGSFTLALAIAVAGKLAVGTGGWPARRESRPAVPSLALLPAEPLP